jgi:hypothetical protein
LAYVTWAKSSPVVVSCGGVSGYKHIARYRPPNWSRGDQCDEEVRIRGGQNVVM